MKKTSSLLILVFLSILFAVAFLIPVIQDSSKALFWGGDRVWQVFYFSLFDLFLASSVPRMDI
jgi:hypothetical protein